MATGLEIKVGADVQDAVNGINQVNKSLSALPKGTKQAGLAVTDLSRIISDAPFSILSGNLIAVSNNIDPLINSFRSLNKEAGGGKAAFQALIGSLSGGAGLALAISAVTAAVTLYSAKQSQAAAETKKAKDEVKSFADIQKDVSQSVAKEASRIELLVRVLQTETTSRQNKANALKEIQKLSPEYFNGLKIEQGLVNGLSDAYAEYVKNIGLTIEAKTIEKQLEQINAKLLEGKTQNQLNLVISKALANVFKESAKQGGDAALSQKLINQTLKDNTKLTGEDLQLNFQKNTLFNRLLELYKLIKVEQTGGKEETKKTVDILEDYNNALAALIFRETATGADLLRQKLDLATKTFESFLEKGIKPNTAAFQFINAEVQKFIGQLPQIQAITKQIETISKLDPTIKLPKVQQKGVSISKADQTSPVVITPEALQRQGQYSLMLDEIAAKLAKQQELLNGISTVSNTFIDSFFGALANNQDPFKALADSAKKLVFELGAAVVKALALKAIAALISGGASAGLEGLAGGGGGLLNLVLRGDLLTGAVTRSSGRRRGG